MILDTQRAAETLRESANKSPLPIAVAEYLSAIAKHWELGWLPASPTEIDRATVAIVQAVISTYKLPGVDAGSSQQINETTRRKGE